MTDHTKSTIVVPLEGVESEHCALIVDKGLNELKGVSSHKVELNNRRAIIEGSSGDLLGRAVALIRDLGYGVPTVKKTIPVLQMSCASCAVNVENAIKMLPGVVSGAVNYANGAATIEYIPSVTNLEKIRKAVQDVGYDLLLENEGQGNETIEEIHEKHYQKLKQRTIGAIALTLPVVVIGMFFMDMPYANYIMWVLSTPVVLWFGKDFYINAWKQARHRSANMDTLVALSTGVAYVFSVFNTLVPSFWHARGLHGHVYFEAAAVVISFILLGKLLEDRAKGNTSAAIKKLMNLHPPKVYLVGADQQVKEVAVEEVKTNDVLLVKPGDIVAVDGTIISGSSFVDESMLTGESIPVEKSEGEKVFAGTINQKGSFQFRAEAVGSDTMLAKIITLVQNAQGSKAPVQKLVDKIAGIFVPVVMGIALTAFAVWWMFGGVNGFTHGLMALVTVLVIACPCALGLATPTAIIVGVGRGAENGILIKDAESLELARKVNAVVLDKTGTITEGRPVVTDALWLNEDAEIKKILFTLESLSAHPLAEAVTKYLPQTNPVPYTDFENIAGMGVKARVENKFYFVGNKKLLETHGVKIDDLLNSKSDLWKAEVKTMVWFANEKNALAVLAISDKIKATSVEAVQQLTHMGIEVVMLTGDHRETASAMAKAAGITHFEAEVLPEAKAGFIKKLQGEGKVVAMVGDGINDSAALAQADVSIAMGQGSDIAKDVAKMTIVSSDLNKIPAAIRLSRQTVATIRQNLFWAFIYNVIGIPIAAGLLYPINGFLLNPMIAGGAMALSSLSVVSNSLRLKWKR
ncbi:MAG: cadmium-translocating P-type ATPase [Saprospiraceae bacterium]|nr:cadmium-translocating P-type ATPase [Saprospiraceae bacterium]